MPIGRYLFVGAANGDGLRWYDGRTGAPLGDFTTNAPIGGWSCPVFGPDGSLYVTMWSYTQSVYRFDGKTGDTLGVVVPYGASYGTILFGPDRALYVAVPTMRPAASGEYEIDRYDALAAKQLGTFIPAGSGGLADP